MSGVGLQSRAQATSDRSTAEGAMKHGGAAGLDLGGLLGGGLGALTGAIGSITGGSKTALDGGALPKLTGPVTQFVMQKGFPPGAAEKVVRAVLPKLLELVRKH